MFMKQAVSIAIAAISFGGVATGAPTIIHAADALVANQDFANAREVQAISISTDSLFAPSYESLTDGGFGTSVEFRIGEATSYTASADRTHYVIAEELKFGGIAISSDTHESAIPCTSYTAECVAQVTDDASLIAAVPTWVQH